jgi:general secretion pathway protein D
MNKLIVISACLLFFSTNAYSDDITPQSETEKVQQNKGTQSHSTSAEPRVGRTGKNQRNGAALSSKTPSEMRSKIATENITPEKIREMFTKTKNEKYTKKENYIILNFDNAGLKDVINTISSITNENFILSPGVDARITIHSAKKIPVSEVMNVFESVLEANGISLVRSGEFFKIVLGTAAKQKPTEIRRGSDGNMVPSVDRPVTQIVPVQYVPVAEITTILTPLLSQFGNIIPNPRNNLLIINDLSSSIARLLKIMKEIDVNAFHNTRMFLFKPKYSDVLTLSGELTEILNALNLSSEGIAMVPIERINSLVIFSSSSTLLKTVEGWIRKLDEEVQSGQNIFVYSVQNVKATEIADILRTLYETTEGPVRAKASTRKSKPAKSKTPARRTSTARQQQSSGSSRVEIITFEPTNSLVILAPPGIYREIVSTIKRIDIYPRSVLIEAIIAEVDITNDDELGIQWSILHNVEIEGRSLTGLAQNLSSSTSAVFPTLPPTLTRAATGGLSYFLFRPEKISALLRAIASRTKVNILQSPRLLVRDQEEASIEVGSDIPTATSTTSTTTTDALTQSIEYKTVGKKLKIKPSINDERTVVLDVEQEVSDVLERNRVVGGFSYPEFSSRRTKTSVVVPDKQGIVIGGIIEEKRTKHYEGIPIISSVPILGKLFRYDTDNVTKTELIIIIVPHVLTSRSESEKLTGEFIGKFKKIKSFLDENEVDYGSAREQQK